MNLIEHYPLIKHAHIGLALLSGGLFALRGILALAGSGLGMRAPVRYLSYGIDTALLAAALALLAALHLNPFTTPWLATKLALLVAYIACGTFALKRASTRAGKLLAYALALFCFGMMYSIARRHDPLGFLAPLGA